MITIKKFNFDNVLIEKIPEVNDVLLLGTIGMWTITYIDKNNIIWSGGNKTGIKATEKANNIINPIFIKWLFSLYTNLNKGDLVEGLYKTNNQYEKVKGVIVDAFYPLVNGDHIWVKDIEGYTTPINILSVKKIIN